MRRDCSRWKVFWADSLLKDNNVGWKLDVHLITSTGVPRKWEICPSFFTCVSVFSSQSSIKMAATKGDKHPKAGKKMTGKASVGDVRYSFCFRDLSENF